MRTATVLALTALLAACNRTPPAAEAPAPEPAPAPQASPVGPSAPASLVGAWDVSAQACADRASQQRITITPAEVTFYESGGSFTAVATEADGATALTASMSGEGQEWQERYVFHLTPDGKGFKLTYGTFSMDRVKCG